MPEPTERATRTHYCYWHDDDSDNHRTTSEEWRQHRTEQLERHRGHGNECPFCFPEHPGYDCSCSACAENYSDPYDDEEDFMARDWREGPHEGDSEDGDFIRAGRTVGVEYERGAMYGTPGWEGRLLPEVGIGSDHCGIEVRTPPAAGRAADRFTRHTLEELIASDFPTGNDSGLHVHVHFPEGYADREWDDSTYRYVTRSDQRANDAAMAKFLALWTAAEHIAFRFSPDRRRCSWSRQSFTTRTERIDMVDRLLAAARDQADPGWAQSRYSSINPNQSGYRTIEFRGHSSTNDVENVMAWVAFVQGMVELSTRVSFITIIRIAYAGTHQKRAQLLMEAGRRHKVWTDTAYAAIRRELGLSPARVRAARAA